MDIPIWLPLLLLLAVCGYWHFHENRQIAKNWRSKINPQYAQQIIRFAWLRSAQVLLVLACCTAIVVAYDTEVGKLRSAQSELSDTITNLQQQNANLTEEEDAKAQAPTPPQELLPTPPQTSNADDTMGSIYNPEQSTNDQQSALDGIKKRYEDILVTYFFLRKCGKIDPADYHIITSALSQEMASVNAPGRMQNDILMSAEGSFQEVYATSKCSDEDTSALYTQYKSYIASLTKEYVP